MQKKVDLYKILLTFGFSVAVLIATFGFFTQIVTSKEYNYKILKVVDGDTVQIEIPGLPTELGHVSLRILHVDTPEKGAHAKCDLERDKSDKATKFVKDTINNGKVIKVEVKKWDKYGGRVLGDLIIDDKRLSTRLLEAGFAVQYEGEKKVKDWCK